ncbi:MAG TPA: MFS transporter [Burkholderiales bacterium]|nr:MFS transporter [Burkholderiales bacterium]
MATPARDERRAAAVACGAHALHDGCTDLVYVMLPVWQAEFGLGYAALGILRTLFSGTLAALQIPSGLLAQRLGARPVLALGTAFVGVGYLIAGASYGLPLLAAALVIGGAGASTQHPLGSSMIARAYPGARSLKALGAYNFAGDIGKMAVPAAVSLLLVVLPWRQTLALLGGMTVLAAITIFALAPRATEGEEVRRGDPGAAGGPSTTDRASFYSLLAIGMLDSAARMAFLTFLPFVLTAKGASLPTIGVALTAVFAGGAAGKLVCAFIGARLGAVPTVWLTEVLTALGIVALLPLPLPAALALLPLLGIALNGTSSVLYGSVPDLVAPAWRVRAFSIFYTGTVGAGALAPVLYGLLGDALGVPAALVVVALVVLANVPLAARLAKPLSARRAAAGA